MLVASTGLTMVPAMTGANTFSTDANQGHVTTVGALNAGSITSGFGNIDNGSSTLDTGAITGTTIDASTDFTVGNTVITTDQILMTPTTGDTFTLASATNGATSLTTVDTAGAAAHLTVVADGNVDIDGLVVTLDAATSIELEGATNVTGALETTAALTADTKVLNEPFATAVSIISFL